MTSPAHLLLTQTRDRGEKVGQTSWPLAWPYYVEAALKSVHSSPPQLHNGVPIRSDYQTSTHFLIALFTLDILHKPRYYATKAAGVSRY